VTGGAPDNRTGNRENAAASPSAAFFSLAFRMKSVTAHTNVGRFLKSQALYF
jgi:hypothetical protein